MTKATYPIVCCDSEDGCPNWELDHYEALVSSIDGVPVKSVPTGWARSSTGEDFCWEHVAESGTPITAGVQSAPVEGGQE